MARGKWHEEQEMGNIHDPLIQGTVMTSGLSVFNLWVKTLETNPSICCCELPIYGLL
jgi:hypothetical protein